MPIPYVKPHLPYPDQVQLLASRGLGISNPDMAASHLRSVGYYRLSAYVYPFRLMLPEAEQCIATPTHYRQETFRPGVTFEDVMALWAFDRKLRLLVLDAMESVEVALRTSLAYVLGERDPMGHIHRASLNSRACTEQYWRDGRSAESRHDRWISTYRDAVRQAATEDFVRHNQHKYVEIPIWIAVEAMSFGQVVRLFNLLRQEDQTRVAAEFGLKGGVMFGSWCESMQYVRNVAAHHSRLWNRTLVRKLRQPNPNQVPEHLRHITQGELTAKVYPALAILAHLVRYSGANDNWPRALMTHVRKFPAGHGLNPQLSMGFPEEWDTLPLWRNP